MTMRIWKLSDEVGASLSSCQVILDLSSAVKELLENALDAGSTVIEIKFKNYGLEFLEVSDNGHGVLVEDLEHLAQRHATSKIQTFEDLDTLSSYGFRGEALHSLCKLGRVKIITAAEEQVPHATEITYDQEANIVSKKVVSSHGTVVRVEQLFYSLPVRRKEFERNYKHDFQKALSMIQSYAIITTGIKLLVTNEQPKKPKIIHFSTRGNMHIKENVANLMGTRLLPTLMDINCKLSILNLYNIEVSGLLSKPICGETYINAKKQYIYINSRPCILPQITRAIGEIYKMYNILQYPFILINLIMPKNSYDINVSVDKRTIFLHHEKEIICELKSILNDLFQNASEKIDQDTISLSQKSNFKNLDQSLDKFTKERFSYSTNDSKTTRGENRENIPEKTNMDTNSSENVPLNKYLFRNRSQEKQNTLSSEKDIDKSLRIEELSSNNRTKYHQESDKSNVSVGLKRKKDDEFSQELLNNSTINSNNGSKSPIKENTASVHNEQGKSEKTIPLSDSFSKNTTETDNIATFSSEANNSITCEISELDTLRNNDHYTRNTISNETKKVPENANVKYLYEYEYRELSTSIVTSKEEIKKKFSEDFLNTDSYTEIESLDVSDMSREQSENQLNLALSKKDFFSMKVIGQFNLGFIIVSLPSHKEGSKLELFIIDQHASDEKYKFEKLLLNTTIESQPLLKPYQLNLTIIEEIVVMEHIEILEKNGFKIELDHNKKPGERCKLVSLPQNKDLEEMISKLQENPQKDVQCNKIRNILASKACRSSVMVGDALTLSTMYNIVKRMGEMDNPWNCPHGRPTIRMIGRISQT
ncbi:unnamed protein product [Pneumocystis jirovecii]|uniref:DNA mismatch repair protein MutL n=1 Tax=Pneumocystis jirovecii TaxID=42068 RepID=L0PGJ5_PNEJI|nr:unnamed protein product [Pneumocystis jirovecii]